MKIRHDFVTNSSSSSFIIALAKKPETVDELKTMLFSEEQLKYGCVAYFSMLHSTDEIANVVFKDISSAKAVSVKKLTKELDGSYGGREWTELPEPEFPYGIEYGSPEYNKAWEVFGTECEKREADIAKNFTEKNKGKKFFVLEYSDNDGSLHAAIEHAGIFDNISHVRVSHH